MQYDVGPAAELSHWQQWAYVERFRDHVRALDRPLKTGLDQYAPAVTTNEREFQVLSELDREAWVHPHAYSAGLHADNIHKNRNPRILPNDATRIRLPVLEGDDCCRNGYINANYVDGPPTFATPTSYIITQAPLGDTVDDFWRMVWCYNVTRIVALADMVEVGDYKSCQYWPTRVGNKARFDTLTVTLVGDETKSGYRVRTVVVKNRKGVKGPKVGGVRIGDASPSARSVGVYSKHADGVGDGSGHLPARTVQIITYSGWETALKSRNELEAILDVMGEVASSNPAVHPVVVHDIYGLGRSGVFVAAHVAIQRFLANKDFSVHDIVRILKAHRTSVGCEYTQSAAQYYLTHRIILAGLERVNRELFGASATVAGRPPQGYNFRIGNPRPPLSAGPPVLVGPEHPSSPARFTRARRKFGGPRTLVPDANAV